MKAKTFKQNGSKMILLKRTPLFISFLFIVFFISSCATMDDYVIEGDTVLINDEDIGRISVTPHTCTTVPCCQYASITSYITTQDLDVAFRFDDPVTGGEIHNQINQSYEVSNFTLECGDDIYVPVNDTYVSNCSYVDYPYTAYHMVWNDVTDYMEHTEYNNKHYYAANDISFVQDKEYQFKWCYDIDISTDLRATGKWDLLVKRSSDTIQEAYNSGNFVMLDPWWNITSYTRKQQINVTEGSGSTLTDYAIRLNVTYDNNMESSFDDLRFLNASETGMLDYWIQQKTDGVEAIVWVEVDTIPASTQTEIYMYYAAITDVDSLSNITATFPMGDDFNALDTGVWTAVNTGTGQQTFSDGILNTSCDADIGGNQAALRTNTQYGYNYSIMARINPGGSETFEFLSFGSCVALPGEGDRGCYRSQNQGQAVIKKDNTILYQNNANAGSESQLDTMTPIDDWAVYEVRRMSNQTWTLVNNGDDESGVLATNLPTIDLYGIIGVASGNNIDSQFDWAVIRQFNFPEPTYTYDTEETAESFANGFGARKTIEINNTHPEILNNFPVEMNISYNANMNPDFSDLRFYLDDDNTELDYWIKDKIDSNYATVFVELDTIEALGGEYNGLSTGLVDDSSTGAVTPHYGMKFITGNVTANLTKITKVSSATQPNCHLLNSSLDALWSGTWSSNDCDLQYELEPNTVYYVTSNGSGVVRYDVVGGVYNISTPPVKWIGAYEGGGSGDVQNRKYNIESIDVNISGTGNKQIYMYYDNDTAVDSQSNGTETFELFDDFEDDSIDTALWDNFGCTETNGHMECVLVGSGEDYFYSDDSFGIDKTIITSSKLNVATNENHLAGVGFSSFDGGSNWRMYNGNSNAIMLNRRDAGGTGQTGIGSSVGASWAKNTHSWTQADYMDFKLKWRNWNVTGCHNESGWVCEEVTSNVPQVPIRVGASAEYDDAEALIDWIAVYTDPTGSDLLYSIGGAEASVSPIVLNSVQINPDPAYTENVLNCSVNYNALNELNVHFNWSKDGVAQGAFDSDVVGAEGTGVVAYSDVDVTPLTEDEVWVCTVYIEDSTAPSYNDTLTSSSVTVGNTHPVFTSAAITWSDYHTEDLNESVTCTDFDNDTITYGILNLTSDLDLTSYMNSTGGINYNVPISATGTHTYNLSCNDSKDTTWQLMTFEVLNNVPTTPTTSPVNDSATFSTAALSCSGSTDGDSDTIYYEFWNATSLMQNTTATTYVWTPPVGTHNWSCNAFDGEDHSANVSKFLSKMSFANCTSGNIALNLTFKNEETNADMNATLPSVDLDFDTLDTYNYIFSEPTINRTEFMFCLNPENVTIATEGSISYKLGTEFPLRTFYFDDNLNGNTSYNQLLYLLSQDSGGIYSTIQVQSLAGAPISGVLIEVSRIPIGGSTYVTVAQGTTDGAGTVQFFLNPDYEHRYVVSKTGYATSTFYLYPTQDTYTIQLALSTQATVYHSNTEGMLWSISPPSGLINAGTNYNFEFNITASKGNLLGCYFEIINATGDQVATASGCASAYGDNISDTYTPIRGDKLYGAYYIKVDTNCTSGLVCEGGPLKDETCATDTDCEIYALVDGDMFWREFNESVSSWRTIHSFWQDLSDLDEFGEGGEAEFSRIVWFFLIMTIVIGAATFFTGWETNSDGAAILIVTLIMVIGSLGGFFNLLDLNPNFTGAWVVWVEKFTVPLIAVFFAIGWWFNDLRRKQTA